MNSIYISHAKTILGKYFTEILNYTIKLYNHNIDMVYIPMFEMLDQEFNFIISVLFDYYVHFCQHIGSIMINGDWEHYRHKIILDLIRNQYVHYLNELKKRLNIMKIYIILLENSLKFQGWVLLETIFQFKCQIPTNLVKKIIVNKKFIQPTLLTSSNINDLKNINSIIYNFSPTVKYINEMVNSNILNIFEMIMKRFEQVTWLEDILTCPLYDDDEEIKDHLTICNKKKKDVSTSKENKIYCLEDILRTKDLNIFKEGLIYKYKKSVQYIL